MDQQQNSVSELLARAKAALTEKRVAQEKWEEYLQAQSLLAVEYAAYFAAKAALDKQFQAEQLEEKRHNTENAWARTEYSLLKKLVTTFLYWYSKQSDDTQDAADKWLEDAGIVVCCPSVSGIDWLRYETREQEGCLRAYHAQPYRADDIVFEAKMDVLKLGEMLLMQFPQAFNKKEESL